MLLSLGGMEKTLIAVLAPMEILVKSLRPNTGSHEPA